MPAMTLDKSLRMAALDMALRHALPPQQTLDAARKYLSFLRDTETTDTLERITRVTAGWAPVTSKPGVFAKMPAAKAKARKPKAA